MITDECHHSETKLLTDGLQRESVTIPLKCETQTKAADTQTVLTLTADSQRSPCGTRLREHT